MVRFDCKIVWKERIGEKRERIFGGKMRKYIIKERNKRENHFLKMRGNSREMLKRDQTLGEKLEMDIKEKKYTFYNQTSISCTSPIKF